MSSKRKGVGNKRTEELTTLTLRRLEDSTTTVPTVRCQDPFDVDTPSRADALPSPLMQSISTTLDTSERSECATTTRTRRPSGALL